MDESGIAQYLNLPERREIVALLEGLFTSSETPNRDENGFDRVASRVYRWQFEHCEPYRRLCESMGRGVDLSDIGEAPFVPAEAFKEFRLACFPETPGEIIFHTSGTTMGRHGAHHLATTELYDSAAIPWLRKHLLPRRLETPRRFFALTHSPDEAPRSSLVHMIHAAGRRFALESGVEYFYHPEDPEWRRRFIQSLEDAVAGGEPVLIFSTAFALAQILETMEGAGKAVAMPEGSRILETGGYKGKTREIAKSTLYEWAARQLGIPPRAIVNEYGMTEMSSQFYDRTLSNAGLSERDARVKLPPPWVRTLVVDPATRRPVGEGEIGALLHIDLANLDSCAFIATGDAARRVGAGFDLMGRIPEAELRGCSLNFEAMGRK